LRVNFLTAVACNHTVLIIEIFEPIVLVGDLDGELARGNDDYLVRSLAVLARKSLLFTQSLQNRQCKGKGFARACTVPTDDVFPFINRMEACNLNWEKLFDALFPQILYCIGREGVIF